MQEPDQPYNWRTTIRILWVTHLISMVAFSVSLPFIPLYLQQLDVPDPREAALWAGIIAGASGFGMAIFSPVWGVLADRYSKKIMVERAIFGAAIMLLLMAYAQSATQLLIIRIIQGTLTGTVSAGNALVASITPQQHLGRTLGFMQMAPFMGSTLGPFVGGVLADVFGYRVSFIVTGILFAISGLAVLRWVHEPPGARNPSPSFRLPRLRHLQNDMTLRTVFALVPVIFMVQFSTMAIRPVFPLFVAQLTNTTFIATMTGVLLATTGLIAAASSLLSGRATARIGTRLLMLTSVLGSAAAHLGHAVVASVPHLWGVRILLGVFSGMWPPTYSSAVALSGPPERRGTIFGIAASASALGNALGPLTGGYLAATLGIRSVFMASTGVLVVAALWLLRVSVVTEPSNAADQVARK